MSNRRQRFVFGLVATVVGALMFLVASSYIVFRGKPLWLAAGVGALAFPVGPLIWQFLGERSRKKKLAAAKTPPKTTLTASDRYWMRLVVVALIVIGPMIAIGRFDVARATWRNGLWWLPVHYEPTTSHGGALSMIGAGVPRTIDVFGTPLQRVPLDAELVVMAKSPDSDDGRAVMAYGDKQLMLFAEGKGLDLEGDMNEKVAEVNKARGKVPWLPIDEIQLISHSDTSVLASSAGWRTRVELLGTGPSPDLLRELGRAPKDAFFTAAFVPRTAKDFLSTKAGAVWMYKKGEQIVVEGRIEANDEAAAKQLVADATNALDKATHDVPESCREQVGGLVKTIQIDQVGAIVTARVDIDPAKVMGMAFCAMKDK